MLVNGHFCVGKPYPWKNVNCRLGILYGLIVDARMAHKNYPRLRARNLPKLFQNNTASSNRNHPLRTMSLPTDAPANIQNGEGIGDLSELEESDFTLPVIEPMKMSRGATPPCWVPYYGKEPWQELTPEQLTNLIVEDMLVKRPTDDGSGHEQSKKVADTQ